MNVDPLNIRTSEKNSSLYLIDTNVISTTSPSQPSSALGLWLEARADRLFLSVVTVAEIESGIAKLRRTGRITRAGALSDWLETLLHFYSGRILPVDFPVAWVAGLLTDHARSQGQAPGFADIVIAATAQHHRLTLLTRNLRHFEPLGIAVVDPFERLPG
jgi:hypothetical protein